MKRRMLATLALGFGLIMGCSTATGESHTESNLVQTSDYTQDVMYMDLAISNRPMTAAEIGDTQFATPVRVEFHNGVAAAFFAPDGVPVYSYANVIAAWHYTDFSGTTRNTGTVDEEPGGETNDPGEVGFATPVSNANAVLRENSRQVVGVDFQVIDLDWIDDVIERIEELPPGWHPGC